MSEEYETRANVGFLALMTSIAFVVVAFYVASIRKEVDVLKLKVEQLRAVVIQK